MTNYKILDNCVACGSNELKSFFDLGLQPLANSYKKSKNEHEKFFPLGVNFCKNCFHVQLTHVVNPDLLFRDYSYVSGVNKPMLEFFEWFAEMSVNKFINKPKTVLDIGCNDASQLDYYKKLGLETYGVDPAENLFVNTSKRHNIVCDYFKNGLLNKKFDLVTIQNAFAHNYDQLEMLLAAKSVLADNGLLFIQTSQGDMITNGEFDTIYHEHISFYNINSMNEICKRANLNLVDVIRHPIHGNSYIFIISKNQTNHDHIQNLINQEKTLGYYSYDTFTAFGMKANQNVSKIKNKVNELKNKGYKIVGFGAPAKGNTFLNFSKLELDFIIDETPQKKNKYTPGMGIPIYGLESFDDIEHNHPVCFLVLAWNYYPTIKQKIMRQRNMFHMHHNDVYLTYFPEYKEEKIQLV